MRRFVPHILFFVVLATVAVAGILWKLQPIAVFIGSFAALCTDPLLVLIALAIGALSRSLLTLLLASLVAGIVFSLYIASINAPFGAEFTVRMTFIRTSAILALALAANVIRLLVVKDRAT